MSDDDSDGWGMEELVIPPKSEKCYDNNDDNNDVGEDYWKVEKSVETNVPNQQHAGTTNKQQHEDQGGEPMIIVDVTQINPDIHSKFDRNSVNQPEQASALRKKIEKNYEDYAFSNEMLSEGTILPCGTSVWRDALVRLRDERPGHYFVPIFKPKTK